METVYIAILVLIASSVGTMTGFGISTIMIPVLLLFLPLPRTLLFVGIIHWFGNLWKVLLFRKGLSWKLILGFGVPGIIAGFVGASLTFRVSEHMLMKILGGFLLGYAVFVFLRPGFQLAKTKKT